MSIIQSKIVEFNQKWLNLIENFQFWSSFFTFLIKLHDFWYKIEIRIQIWVRIWIEIVATIDRTGKFGSKMSIKRRFEYNLDRILGWPWLDRISLHYFLFWTLYLYPECTNHKCTNHDHVDFPNTTIPTIPSVRAQGYTLW